MLIYFSIETKKYIFFQFMKLIFRYEERQFVSNLNGHVLGVFDAGSMMKHGHKDESSVLGQSWLLRSDGRVIAKVI